jgi:hypothetical protein
MKKTTLCHHLLFSPDIELGNFFFVLASIAGILILKGTISSSLMIDITFGVVLRTKYWIYKDSNFGDFPQKIEVWSNLKLILIPSTLHSTKTNPK